MPHNPQLELDEKIPLRLLRARDRSGLQFHVNGTVLGLGIVCPVKAYDLLARLDHPFRKQETRRQFKVIAGGSHGHGEGLVCNLDEQRLFPHQGIV